MSGALLCHDQAVQAEARIPADSRPCYLRPRRCLVDRCAAAQTQPLKPPLTPCPGARTGRGGASVVPYGPHAVQHWLMSSLPQPLLEYLVLGHHHGIRKRALKKKEASKKEQ